MVDNVASVDTATARPGRAWHVVLWVLQVLGAVSFLLAGYQKLAGTPDMVTLFSAIGAGQWFRFVTGTLETLGGIALLVPRLRALGALGLIGVMIGALITDFALGISPLPALVELVIVAVIAWGRRPGPHDQHTVGDRRCRWSRDSAWASALPAGKWPHTLVSR